MATTAWTALVLATDADLQAEIGEGSVLLSAYDIQRRARAYTAIKNQIFIDLKSNLTELFVSRNGQYRRFDMVIREMGYTYNDLDTMLDKIGNPELLLEVTKAKWAAQLWEWLSSDDRPNWKSLAGVCLEKVAEYDKKYKGRLKEAQRNLWLDLNGDGQIVDNERVRTHNSFVRT